jgi:hypothetical protein
LGWTNDVAWISVRPVRARASISSTLRAVGMNSCSIWKPSRGPTSQTTADVGSRSIVSMLSMASSYDPASASPTT